MRSEAISDEDENVLSTVHCKGLIILISIRYSNRMYPQRKCHLCVVLIYSYKNVAAILTFLCFELEQIHGPFFSWGLPSPFVERSGLGFGLTQSIAEIWQSWDVFNHWVITVISRLCFELEQIQSHFFQQIGRSSGSKGALDLLWLKA